MPHHTHFMCFIDRTASTYDNNIRSSFLAPLTLEYHHTVVETHVYEMLHRIALVHLHMLGLW